MFTPSNLPDTLTTIAAALPASGMIDVGRGNPGSIASRAEVSRAREVEAGRRPPQVLGGGWVSRRARR